MGKKRIFWAIQQLNKIAGTEMVTIQLISMLSKDYEIHLVPFDSESIATCSYDLPEGIVVENIHFPSKISQFDIHYNAYMDKHQPFKAFGLFFKMIGTYIFGRRKYRKLFSSISKKDDIFIFASKELLLFAPKNRLVVEHFHYNSRMYRSAFVKWLKPFSRKPDMTIFITDSTRKAVGKENDESCFDILNPSRYPRVESYDYHNNHLLAVLRYEDQKDPMLLMEIGKVLKERGFPFSLNLYGSGSYEGKMKKYIEENDLGDCVHLNGVKKDLAEIYQSADLHILTSKFEGFPLTVVEANSNSVPTISMDMGDPTSSMIKEGENGYVITRRDANAFADKIIEVLSDKERLKELKKSAYLYSANFLESAIKEKWLKTLEKIFAVSEEKFGKD